MPDQPGEAPDDLPRNVLDNLLEGCQVIDPEYRYIYVNDAVVRHGKTTREALLGRTMMEVYPGIEQTEMFELLRRCMEERVARQMENEFTFPDGSTGWFELRFEPVPEGVAILSVDITERIRAEESLRRSMRAQRTLSRCNQTLVMATDEHDFVRDVCTLIVEDGEYPMACVSKGDAPDVRALEIASRDGEREILDMDEGQALLRRATESDESFVQRLSDDSDDAEWRSALQRHGVSACVAVPMVTGEHRVGTLLIFADEERAFDSDERGVLNEVGLDLGYGVQTLRDRASRDAALEKLSEAQQRTRAIYDHLPDATFVFKRDEASFRLIDFNQVAAEKTNGRAAALKKSSVTSFDGCIPNIEDDLARSFEERSIARRELECRLPGGAEEREMVLTYGFIPPDMVLLHVRDVTEQRRTERQLIASQRLEAVGRLAGGVAHDFNNMLSVILMCASFSIDQLRESDPVRREIEHVHEAAERAADLTRQLLAFSRKQVLQPKVMRVNQTIATLEPMMRRLVQEDIDIEVHASADAGNIVADAAQIEQVIMNLAVNARDAMPRGGKITIETANVELDEDYARSHVDVSPGRYVRLTVADTGTGMDSETLDRIFEPFFTTKEERKGTGLGLATVYGIVKQSGGHIWVYSEPQSGTTFKVYFPRVDAPAADESESDATVVATGDETVLLVEDEPGVRRAAARILRAAGYTVLTAERGEEAIRVAEEHSGRIDLLLTDVVMPGMSGGELANRLTARMADLKVIFTSGYTGNAAVHHGVLDPGSTFIGKPFSAHELTRKVRRVLDGGS